MVAAFGFTVEKTNAIRTPSIAFAQPPENPPQLVPSWPTVDSGGVSAGDFEQIEFIDANSNRLGPFESSALTAADLRNGTLSIDIGSTTFPAGTTSVRCRIRGASGNWSTWSAWVSDTLPSP